MKFNFIAIVLFKIFYCLGSDILENPQHIHNSYKKFLKESYKNIGSNISPAIFFVQQLQLDFNNIIPEGHEFRTFIKMD
jgi:hypothetical protein